jgi:hypothetical protein
MATAGPPGATTVNGDGMRNARRWTVLGLVSGVVLTVVGVGVTVWSLVSGPSVTLRFFDVEYPSQNRRYYEPSSRPTVVECRAPLGAPDGEVSPPGTVADGDLVDGSLTGPTPEWTSMVRSLCERLRSARTGTAVLVALPTALIGSATLALATLVLVVRRRPGAFAVVNPENRNP